MSDHWGGGALNLTAPRSQPAPAAVQEVPQQPGPCWSILVHPGPHVVETGDLFKLAHYRIPQLVLTSSY